ncbi:MAG: hypothetical protein SNH79_03510 [Rikenellaceae bacterium]
MNRSESAKEWVFPLSFEAQFASAIKHAGYVPKIKMEGVVPEPNCSMPWAVVEASRIVSVDGCAPVRVESKLEFTLYQNVLSCSNAQKMAVAAEISKDVLDVIAEVKTLPGIVEVIGLSTSKPLYTSKPSEQVSVTASVKIVSNYRA